MEPRPWAWTTDDERVAVAIDTSIYSVPAALAAAYKLTDRAYVFLTRDPDSQSTLWASIRVKPAHDLAATVGDFANELVDQQLRVSLRSEFGQVQALIVAQAFSSTNLLDSARDEGDYRADPRGAGTRR